MKFTTEDVDHDTRKDGNCAVHRGGPWWYRNCGYSGLNNKYLQLQGEIGVLWHGFKGWKYSYKVAEMKMGSDGI